MRAVGKVLMFVRTAESLRGVWIAYDRQALRGGSPAELPLDCAVAAPDEINRVRVGHRHEVPIAVGLHRGDVLRVPGDGWRSREDLAGEPPALALGQADMAVRVPRLD